MRSRWSAFRNTLTSNTRSHSHWNTARKSSAVTRFADLLTCYSSQSRSVNSEKKNNKPSVPLSTVISLAGIPAVAMAEGGAAASSATTGAVTTAAGFTMAPAMVTVLSNLPLVAFGAMQLSGMEPIRHIIREKNTGDYSPFPFISLYTNCAIWTLYGYLKEDTTILIANGAGVLFGVLYTALFTRYTHMSMTVRLQASGFLLWLLLSSPHWAVSSEAAANLLGMTGSAAAIILMSSPLATIRTVWTKKETSSMSLAMSSSMFLNAFAWTAYGVAVAGDPYVIVPNSIGLLSASAQLALFAIFPSKRESN